MDGVKNKQRVGILTFHWADDFGAMLQATGLKSTLEELGLDTKIVPYSNRNLSGRYWLFCWVGTRDAAKQVDGYWDINRTKWNIRHFPSFFRRRRAMRVFRKTHLTPQFGRKGERKLHFREYDYLVVGSDQVWNPEITVGVDHYYFGEFGRKSSAKLIAYAASIGQEHFDEVDGRTIGAYIDKHFDYVSVREKSSILALREFCTKEICDMPDPVFLCEKAKWEETANDSGIKEEYVLVYVTEKNEALHRTADLLCEKYHLKKLEARYLPIGPADFLGLVKGAKYIVTNSFHCSAFAIIFHKCFFTFAHSERNARLHDLLDNVGLLDRVVEDSFSESSFAEPDWEKVDEKLCELRKKGRDYLKDCTAGTVNE